MNAILSQLMLYTVSIAMLLFIIKLYRYRTIYFSGLRQFYKQHRFSIILSLSVFILFLFSFHLVPFGLGLNIEDAQGAYQITFHNAWNRCEGGTLDNCVLLQPASNPIFLAYILANLFFLLGYPLGLHDAVFFIGIFSCILLLLSVLSFRFSKYSVTKKKGSLPFVIPIASLLFLYSATLRSLVFGKHASILDVFLQLMMLVFLYTWLEKKQPAWLYLALSFFLFASMTRPNSILTGSFLIIIFAFLYRKEVRMLLLDIPKEKVVFAKIDIIFTFFAFVIVIFVALEIGTMHMNSAFTFQGDSPFLLHIASYLQFMSQPLYFIVAILGLTSLFFVRSRETIFLLWWYLFALLSALLYPGDPRYVPPRYLLASFIPLFIMAQMSIEAILAQYAHSLVKKRVFSVGVLITIVILLIPIYFSDEPHGYNDYISLGELVFDVPDNTTTFVPRTIHMRYLLLSGKTSFSIFHKQELSSEQLPVYFAFDKQVCLEKHNYIDSEVLYPLCQEFINSYSWNMVIENDYFILYKLDTIASE